MKKAVFRNPEGEQINVINIETLKELMINQFETYWMKGSGDGFIDYYENNKIIATLMIGPNIEYGIYLHYIDVDNHKDFLSLYDRDKLDDVAETADEIYASVGLFLPKEIAWDVIVYFVNSGKISPKIKWITPDDIPETGNW